MSKKSKTPIYDYYQSLADEPRGTMGKFVLWLCRNTALMETAVRIRLKKEDWSPIERAFIMEAIESGSWKNDV